MKIDNHVNTISHKPYDYRHMTSINYFIIQMPFVISFFVNLLPCKERTLFFKNIKKGKILVTSYHQCSIKSCKSGSNRLICKIESCDFLRKAFYDIT